MFSKWLLRTFLILIPFNVYAADSTVASLSAASALDGTELYYCVQGGADRKCTGAQIKTWTSASPTLVTPVLGVATATTINGLTLTSSASGVLTIAAGKTFTSSNTLTLTATDGSTLAIGTGGTLGSNAYTSTAFAPLASPTFTGTVTIPTPFTLGAVSVTSTGTQLNYLNAATGTTGTTSTNVVFSTSPILVTPTLGVASATSINKVAITAPASSATLTIADGKTATHNASTTFAGTDGKTLTISNSGTLSGGDAFVLSIAAAKTLTVSNTLTFTGTDSSSVAFGAGGTVLYSGGALGTPSSGTLTNASGLILSSGVTAVAWTQTTPTPTCGSGGGIETLSSIVRTYQYSKIALVSVKVTVTTNGTCATSIIVGMPFTVQSTNSCMFTGRSDGIAGLGLVGRITAGGTSLTIWNVTGTYPGATGEQLDLSGSCEIA